MSNAKCINKPGIYLMKSCIKYKRGKPVEKLASLNDIDTK